MRLTADQIHRIVREIEALEYGEVLVRVQGPGRPVRILVTRSLSLGDDLTETQGIDTSKRRGVDSR